MKLLRLFAVMMMMSSKFRVNYWYHISLTISLYPINIHQYYLTLAIIANHLNQCVTAILSCKWSSSHQIHKIYRHLLLNGDDATHGVVSVVWLCLDRVAAPRFKTPRFGVHLHRNLIFSTLSYKHLQNWCLAAVCCRNSFWKCMKIKCVISISGVCTNGSNAAICPLLSSCWSDTMVRKTDKSLF